MTAQLRFLPVLPTDPSERTRTHEGDLAATLCSGQMDAIPFPESFGGLIQTMDVAILSNEPMAHRDTVDRGSGFLVFTGASRLIFMNHQAWTLMEKLTRASDRLIEQAGRPQEVNELSDSIRALLGARNESKNCEQLQLHRLSGTTEKPILLRAIGIPCSEDIQHSYIVIFLYAIRRLQDDACEQPRECMALSEQEHAVVQRLIKGLTDIQIADRLGMAEQVVKEHLQMILQKTRSTSRTEALLRVLGSWHKDRAS